MYDEMIAKQQANFEAMIPVLPETVTAVLDIGCGHALVDTFLGQRYPNATFHLMDAAVHVPCDGKNQVGYNEKTVPWKDRNAGIVVMAYHCPGVAVLGHEPDPLKTIPCDLVISTRSWGHHYPISEYIFLVERSLSADGRIIVDLRFDTPGREMFLATGFELVSVITGGSQKCERTVWQRAQNAAH